MPNIKSAKKRVTVIARRKEENRYVKSTLATMVKKFRATVNAGEFDAAEKMLPELTAYIYSAQTKGVIHMNAAARKVGRLNSMLFKAKTAPAQAAAPAVEEVKAEEKVEAKAEEKPAKKTTKKAATETEAKTETKKTTKKAKAE